MHGYLLPWRCGQHSARISNLLTLFSPLRTVEPKVKKKCSAAIYDTDPNRPIGDWKESWEKARQRAATILKGNGGQSGPCGSDQEVKNVVLKRQEKSNGKEDKSVSLHCRFHDLRHTAVARLLEAGIPYPVVASMMGWSAATAIRMAKRYGHIGSQALREAADVPGRTKISWGPSKSPQSRSR